MKILFWILSAGVFIIELYLLQGVVNMLSNKYTPINMSSVRIALFFMVLGGALIGGGIYLKSIHKVKWACAVVGSPLILLAAYFLFLMLPYFLGERMN